MPSAPLISIAIDPAAPTPLFQQVYEALRRLIISGQIASGSRLPASRPLAGELSVSRTTIVAAYDQLAAEGFIHGCGGSGVFVTHIGEVEIDRGPPPDLSRRRWTAHLLVRSCPFSLDAPTCGSFPTASGHVVSRGLPGHLPRP